MPEKKYKKFIAGGCSFTYGNELSDDDGKVYSKQTWAYRLYEIICSDKGLVDWSGNMVNHYKCVANPGSGNSGIARRVFQEINKYSLDDIDCVVVMWSFPSRYDWAMPRHADLEDKRWTNISPWDVKINAEEMHNAISNSEPQQEWWKRRKELVAKTGVGPFADALYRHAASQYHEIYLSWKSIVWLQNILEKRKIPFMFTLADNSLFYDELEPHHTQDNLLLGMYNEIDFTNWYSFGERNMGFNQWSIMEEYERGTTHPLDKAHVDAVKLIQPTFEKLIGGKLCSTG